MSLQIKREVGQSAINRSKIFQFVPREVRSVRCCQERKIRKSQDKFKERMMLFASFALQQFNKCIKLDIQRRKQLLHHYILQALSRQGSI